MKAYDLTAPPALNGLWLFSRKLDGVQAVYDGNNSPVSRRGKPLHGLPIMPAGKYEVFIRSWEETVSHVRSHDSPTCNAEYLYRIDAAEVDSRLIIASIENPTALDVAQNFYHAITKGDEGLVLHGPSGKALKVKTTHTWDVPVQEIIPGKGKHVGRMGALMTPMGKVGTGFTDAERDAVWVAGEVIEVEAMEVTPAGKFRHPRFLRKRFDK